MAAKRLVSHAIVAVLTGGFFIGIVYLGSHHSPPSHEEIAGAPSLKANASQLKQTLVTPHLEAPIPQGKNVLWCATAQIAWNELCRLAREDVRIENAPEMVEHLNKKSVTRDDLDEASYVAMAGMTSDGILEKIEAALEKKFGGAASPVLLPASGSDVGPWVTYSYLSKNLPFMWAFDLTGSLKFGDARVECFGIEQFLTSQEKEARAAEQIFIYDFRNGDDFIIELKTRARDDRLILAKVPPGATLEATAESVQERVACGSPTKLQEGNDLIVPVLNFDITREYTELCGRKILAKDPHFAGSSLAIATQNIRFKLDETGAMLKSEAIVALGVAQSLIFDKPFLVLLQRRTAKMPYFALWVGNAELLVPFKGESEYSYGSHLEEGASAP